MITAYFADRTNQIITKDFSSLANAIWIDLFSPSAQEKAAIEKYLGLLIPTKEEMREIELSSRLYRDNDSLIMTSMMVANSGSPMPQYEPITFILTKKQIITVRYIEPQSFKLFIGRMESHDFQIIDAPQLLVELLDAAADRLADTLELIGNRLSDYSSVIFHDTNDEKADYNVLMRNLGATGTLTSKARESLENFSRLISFFYRESKAEASELGQNIKLVSDDIKSLNEHVTFLSAEINFLLNATLGLITIEQNNIIKIFSVMAVIFLPPTLIATIYGMNFAFMPEISWTFGYPFALGLILLTSWLPYKYFKMRKWL